MLFATSSNGNSDVNIVGVLPKADGAGWLVTIREDSETTAEVLAADAQSQFQFVYVPFNASHLVGGHIIGSTKLDGHGCCRRIVFAFSIAAHAAS